MALDGDPSGALGRYREHLMLLARLQIDPTRAGPIDPSDLVQQTLLKAHEKSEQFRGTTDAERAAWLRTILENTLADAFRRLRRIPGGRERSLEGSIDQSSARLELILAADESSPSVRADRGVKLLRLARALAGLPDDQRQAVELRHLQGLPLAEIGARMGRSIPAVGGLLQRGLRALRVLLDEES